MNAYKIGWRDSFGSIMRGILAILSIWTLLCGTLLVGASAQQKPGAQGEARRLSEERRILHVLNRLGFGARPTDVGRVRAMGVEQYVRQQLEPEKIADAAVEAKLQALPSLRMTTAELYAKYPQPGALLRQMERRGELPAELAALREKRGKASAKNAGASTTQGDGESMNTPSNGQAAGTNAAQEQQQGADRNEYRRAMRDYLLKNGLQPPQRLVAELQASRILRAVYSERQLQEVMVDFWTNHFNIFAGKGADKWLLVAYDRDTIRPNAMGKFRDLLQATAESPAMLFYLDNFRSVSPKAAEAVRNRMGQRPSAREMSAGMQTEQARQKKRPQRGINENYARELMELHTLGVDGGYTQRDVQEVARCFTGWTITNPRGFRRGAETVDAGKFYFNPRLHDNGEKIVLGQKIPAGGGVRDGLMVLDILARHPATARFMATKLARRFVMDKPTPALVERISAAFTRNDGDVRETLRALFTSPEFNSPEAYRAKIKTPFELAVSAIRTLGGETDGGPALHRWIAKMGEGLYQYQAPTGYPDTAEDWVNAGSLLERLNFGLALASNRIPGTRVDLARFLVDNSAGSNTDRSRVMERFLNVIVQGDISQGTRNTLTKQSSEPTRTPAANTEMNKGAGTQEKEQQANTRPLRRQATRAEQSAGVGDTQVVKLVGLILGSPEFQRQ